MKQFAVAYFCTYDSDIRIEFIDANSGFEALKEIFSDSYQPEMSEQEFVEMLYDSDISVTYKEITQ